MKNKNTITLFDENDEEKEYRIITSFEIEENDNLYIVYTDDYIDEDGFTNVYAGIYNENNQTLMKIETDEEWDLIEEILKRIEKGK